MSVGTVEHDGVTYSFDQDKSGNLDGFEQERMDQFEQSVADGNPNMSLLLTFAIVVSTDPVDADFDRTMDNANYWEEAIEAHLAQQPTYESLGLDQTDPEHQKQFELALEKWNKQGELYQDAQTTIRSNTLEWAKALADVLNAMTW